MNYIILLVVSIVTITIAYTDNSNDNSNDNDSVHNNNTRTARVYACRCVQQGCAHLLMLGTTQKRSQLTVEVVIVELGKHDDRA